MNIVEFLQGNLLHVLPILTAGAIAIAIIIERTRALYQTYPLKKGDEFLATITHFVMEGKIKEAAQHCDKYPDKPIAKVVQTALMRSHLPESVIEDGLQIVTSEATQAILKRTSFLGTIANVATLLGLFGTIAGLIHSFEAVGHADAQQKAALLSAGIATAMNATMLGLGVAIPCMIAFSFLMNRSHRLITEVQNSAVKILDILKQRFYTSEAFEQTLSHTQAASQASPATPTRKSNGASSQGHATSSRRVA